MIVFLSIPKGVDLTNYHFPFSLYTFFFLNLLNFIFLRCLARLQMQFHFLFSWSEYFFFICNKMSFTSFRHSKFWGECCCCGFLASHIFWISNVCVWQCCNYFRDIINVEWIDREQKKNWQTKNDHHLIMIH